MPSLQQHIEDCYNILGESYIEVHQWLDEYAKIYFPLKIHRVHRHHIEGVEKVKKIYGEKAAKAAMIHILSDEGEILTEEKIREKYINKNKGDAMKVEIPYEILEQTGIIELAQYKWNNQADEYNKWDELGEDEKSELISKELTIEITELADRHPQEVTGAEFADGILIYTTDDKK